MAITIRKIFKSLLTAIAATIVAVAKAITVILDINLALVFYFCLMLLFLFIFIVCVIAFLSEGIPQPLFGALVFFFLLSWSWRKVKEKRQE